MSPSLILNHQRYNRLYIYAQSRDAIAPNAYQKRAVGSIMNLARGSDPASQSKVTDYRVTHPIKHGGFRTEIVGHVAVFSRVTGGFGMLKCRSVNSALNANPLLP